jgi:outer membrane protein assembly factor BamE
MRTRDLALLLLPTLLSGCSATLEEKLPELSMPNLSLPELSMPSVPGIYRADIHQGNIIEQQMIDQLKPGMNKRQVRHIMGSPLLVDTFHQERWDYFYSLKQGGELQQQKRISLFFEGEKLARLEGDLVPTTNSEPPTTNN